MPENEILISFRLNINFSVAIVIQTSQKLNLCQIFQPNKQFSDQVSSMFAK